MTRSQRQYWRTAPRVVDAQLAQATEIIDQVFVDESIPQQADDLTRMNRLNAELRQRRNHAAQRRIR